ncbi:serine/arginine-rich splicing factor SR45a-like, partial [Gastrolobium bilobum]|uniref:serine/arginine-rich splicing factor SR45a-like n=1 Tax=Gastrolobium bilobum TaxID=150636 RepID=UPI002AB2AB64
SRSRSRFRTHSRSQDSADARNPGNNLYVTGLSTRITSRDLEKYFNKEGKVVECHLVTDPRSKKSRGYGFVTMESNHDAERCTKYLDRSVFEGRLTTVEKAKRSRDRTPIPGRYRGSRDKQMADMDGDDHVIDGSIGRTDIIIQGTGVDDYFD